MLLSPAEAADLVAYDFRRPPWIDRDRRAVLDGIHARLVPAIAQQLGAQVGRPVSVTIREVAQVGFGDWRATLPSPAITFLVALGPGEAGEGLVVVEPALALGLVDLLLGGEGEPGERLTILTPLEQTVLGKLVDRFLALLAAGYQEVAPLEPGPARFEEIVERMNIVARHDRVYLMDLEWRAGQASGGVSVCLPASLLAGFVRGDSAAPGDGQAEPARPLAEAHLRAARVPAVVRLPGLRLSARDAAALAPGQVFETSHLFQGTVELHVNGRALFLGALGRQHGHVGLRVLGPVEPATPPPTRVMRRIATP